MAKTNEREGELWKVLLIVIMVALLITITPYISYHYELNISSNPHLWGVFGDYLGGALGPLVGLITIYLVYKTYKAQQTELYESRIQFKDSIKAQRSMAEIEQYHTSKKLYITDIEASLNLIKDEKIGLYQSLIGGENFQFNHPLEPAKHVYEGADFNFEDYKTKYAEIIETFFDGPIQSFISALINLENLKIPDSLHYDGYSREVDLFIYKYADLLYFFLKLDALNEVNKEYIERKFLSMALGPEYN